MRVAPAASRAKKTKHTSVVTTGPPGTPGIPCAMVYGLLRALPGDRAFLSPSLAEIYSADLTPASGRQDHTTSPSASRRPRLWRRPRPPHPAPTFVTMANAPLPGQDGGSRRTDLPDGLSEIFLQKGLDRKQPDGQITLSGFKKSPSTSLSLPNCSKPLYDGSTTKWLCGSMRGG